MAWSSESAGSNLCNERSTFARCVRSSERRAFSAFAISSCSFMSRCIQFELKGVVPTNYPATTEPHGLRRPKNTNAMIARSRSKRQRHDPPTAKGDNPCGNAAGWPDATHRCADVHCCGRSRIDLREEMTMRLTMLALVTSITTTASAQGLVPYYGPDGQVYYRRAPDAGYAAPGVPPDIIAPERPRGAPRQRKAAPHIAVA